MVGVDNDQKTDHSGHVSVYEAHDWFTEQSWWAVLGVRAAPASPAGKAGYIEEDEILTARLSLQWPSWICV